MPRARWMVVVPGSLVLAWSLAAGAARPTVTIATYTQDRYKVMQEQLLPEWKQKFPDINIEVTLYPDLFTKLLVVMGTEAAPDIVDTAGTYLFGHVLRGGAVDLAPLLQRDTSLRKDDWFPHTLDEVRYPFRTGAGLYALPYEWVGGVVYYNQDLLDAAGLSAPSENWTWVDLRQMAKKLVRDRNGDGKVDVWGVNVNSTHLVFDPLVRAYGGQILTADRTRAALDSPEAAEALKLLVAMIHEDGSAPPPGVAASFASGQLAIWIEGSWQARTLAAAPDLRWGVQVVPRGPVKHDIYGGSNMWEVMRRPGQDLQAVWTVLKELVSLRALKAFSTARVPYSLPARRSLVRDWPQTPLTLVLARSAPAMRDADWTADWAQWQAAKRAEIDQVLAGKLPITEGLQRAAQAINAALERAGRQ